MGSGASAIQNVREAVGPSNCSAGLLLFFVICRRKRVHDLCLEGHDLVFRTPLGKPINADYLAKHFRLILPGQVATNQALRFAPLGGHNRAGSWSVAKSCL